MAQDNEYVRKLIAARDREVTHRRDIVEALAEKHNRGHLFSPLIAVVPFTSNDYRKLAEGCFRLAREAKIEADAHAR